MVLPYINKRVCSAPITNPQGIPRILVIHSFQPSILFSRFIKIESIKRTSNTCSTFGRPCIILPYLDFSYINVTNISPS
ncbi:hypothetical protein ES332_D03G113100v1 [Gossypium tomentosum]|uniref:Uncharacterized protein n=1 Tax=Gossypium tomentosum TaxID=34277 RepID=A0A5D2LND4_GOSTO|nr:hypothetical protein ES332_D03G113100v1 [Gossypium tomentosum]